MMIFRSKPWNPLTKCLLRQLLLVVLFCIISYFWLDRSLAVLMTHLHHAGSIHQYNVAIRLTGIIYFVALALMVFYAYMRIIKKSTGRLFSAIGGISLALPISFFVKTELQYLFGRIQPRYAGNDKLLFIKNPHLYGFHFFSNGSFPSGHMCVFTATLLMLLFSYPKLKHYIIGFLCLLGFLLLFYNYHFLSDIVAGTYVGYLIAFTIHKLQEPQDVLYIDLVPAVKKKPDL